MKRIVSLLLSVLLFAALALPGAAAKKEPQVWQIFRNVDGECAELQTFSYDKKGRVSQVKIFAYDYEEPTTFLYTFTYDKKGNVKKIVHYWDEEYGEEYRYTHKYNNKNQITKTTTKMVSFEPDVEEFLIWEDSTTFKYDKSNRLVKKTRDYYGTIITTEYEYGNGYTVVTERAESEGEEINSSTCYYEPNTAPLLISFTDDNEFVICHESLEGITGMYLDDCTYEWDDQGRVVYIYEPDGDEEIEIYYND